MTVVEVDSWTMKDKWWTGFPEVREYIEVEFADGRRVIYVKEGDGEWKILK